MNQSGFIAKNEYNSESKCHHTMMNHTIKNHRLLKTWMQIGGTTPRFKPQGPNKCLHTLKYYA